MGSIRCQRCREVDLEGHWVQLRAHLIGFKKNCNDLFFFKICFKKTIFFNQFSHKGKHVFHHFHLFFGISSFFQSIFLLKNTIFHPFCHHCCWDFCCRTSPFPPWVRLPSHSPRKSPTWNGRVQVPGPSSHLLFYEPQVMLYHCYNHNHHHNCDIQ